MITSAARTHHLIPSWPLASEGASGFMGRHLIVAYNVDSPSKHRTSCHEGEQCRIQASSQSPHVIASTATPTSDARFSSRSLANEGDSASSRAMIQSPSKSTICNLNMACEGNVIVAFTLSCKGELRRKSSQPSQSSRPVETVSSSDAQSSSQAIANEGDSTSLRAQSKSTNTTQSAHGTNQANEGANADALIAVAIAAFTIIMLQWILT